MLAGVQFTGVATLWAAASWIESMTGRISKWRAPPPTATYAHAMSASTSAVVDGIAERAR